MQRLLLLTDHVPQLVNLSLDVGTATREGRLARDHLRARVGTNSPTQHCLLIAGFSPTDNVAGLLYLRMHTPRSASNYT